MEQLYVTDLPKKNKQTNKMISPSVYLSGNPYLQMLIILWLFCLSNICLKKCQDILFFFSTYNYFLFCLCCNLTLLCSNADMIIKWPESCTWQKPKQM